jgi:hypothetical protein
MSLYLADLHAQQLGQLAWQAVISGIFKKDWSATLGLKYRFGD